MDCLSSEHSHPEAIEDHVAGAAGPNSLSVYRFGDGIFETAAINEHLYLALKPGSNRLANVAPSTLMPISAFLNYLAGTRLLWRVEEPE